MIPHGFTNQKLTHNASASVRKKFDVSLSLNQKYFDLACKYGSVTMISESISNLCQLSFLYSSFKCVNDMCVFSKNLISNAGNFLKLIILELASSFIIKHQNQAYCNYSEKEGIELETLPENYIICSLRLSLDLQELYVNRHSKNCGSFSLRLPINRISSRDGETCHKSFQTIFDEWNDIMEQNRRSTNNGTDITSDGRSDWWNRRKKLDSRIKEMLDMIEKTIFGGFKGIFTFPVAMCRIDNKEMDRFRVEIGKILHSCISRKNKTEFSIDELINTHILDLILELTENEIRHDDLEDILYFLVDCYQNYGIQMTLDEMNIDSVWLTIIKH